MLLAAPLREAYTRATFSRLQLTPAGVAGVRFVCFFHWFFPLFFSTVPKPHPRPLFSSARPYIVSWTGANADDRFEIDLHYGGSYSFGFEDVRHTNNYIV